MLDSKKETSNVIRIILISSFFNYSKQRAGPSVRRKVSRHNLFSALPAFPLLLHHLSGFSWHGHRKDRRQQHSARHCWERLLGGQGLLDRDRLEDLVPNTTSLITNREREALEFGCKVKDYYH